MTITRLKPLIDKPFREQCQVVLPDDPSWCITRKQAYSEKSDRRSRRNKPEGWDAQSCQRYVDFHIDGLRLCTNHAARKCLHDRLGEPFPFALRGNAG